MSLPQFFQIIWARRWIVFAATLSCFVGAFLVILIAQPRYEASARVMLNLLKPDPVTGEVIATNASRTYVATQKELVTDYGVVGDAVERLGWLTDPARINSYRSEKRTSDFRYWLAEGIITRTNANIVSGSNILEISYTAGSPDQARLVVETLRQAYLDSTLAARREDAARNASWYTEQAESTRRLVEAAESAKAAYERESGIVLQADQTDVDSDRLRALAGQATTGAVMMPAATSGASLQLAQIDAQLAQVTRNLGPNHPEVQELRARRSAVASLVAQEASAARSSAASTNSIDALDRAVQSQKTRVLAQRDKLEKLRQLQAEVDLRREQYKKTSARAAELTQESLVADSGITALGSALVPQKPVFPNKPLIVGGSIFLGLFLGLLVALLTELLHRRVRSVEDLVAYTDLPVLAVVAPPSRGANRFKIPVPARLRLRKLAAAA